MGLYDNVKTVCGDKGISINALEKRLDFPKSYLCKWNHIVPSIGKVKEVADALDVGVDTLIKDVVFPKRGEG